MIQVRSHWGPVVWTYEAFIMGWWQPVTRAEIDKQLRRGVSIHWNPTTTSGEDHLMVR